MTTTPNIPRFPLIQAPTPLARMTGLEQHWNVKSLWVKRDDLTGFAVAGNKARPLEFLVGEAVRRGFDALVTGGSPDSNFCAAAAAAAANAGLGCHLVYAAGEDAVTRPAVALARYCGARLHLRPELDRSEVDGAVRALADELSATGVRAAAIPRGGANATGALGAAFAARETTAQLGRLDRGQWTVVVPVGSGCTYAGLHAVFAGHPEWIRLVGSSVSRPVADITASVAALSAACASILGVPAAGPGTVDIRDAIGAGFGIPDDEDRAVAAAALRTQGLLVDMTYGTKALRLARRIAANTERPVLFWATGGLQKALAAVETS